MRNKRVVFNFGSSTVTINGVSPEQIDLIIRKMREGEFFLVEGIIEGPVYINPSLVQTINVMD